jgi:hypothetical protein
MDDNSKVDLETQVVVDGLQASPQELHASFEIANEHLSEVRDRHTMMLATAGELPESQIASIAPERRLKWMVEELNGRTHQDGFTIPLQGADSTMIDLVKGEIEGHSILKISAGSEFERNIPIPAALSNIQAKVEDGVLSLNW